VHLWRARSSQHPFADRRASPLRNALASRDHTPSWDTCLKLIGPLTVSNYHTMPSGGDGSQPAGELLKSCGPLTRGDQANHSTAATASLRLMLIVTYRRNSID